MLWRIDSGSRAEPVAVSNLCAVIHRNCQAHFRQLGERLDLMKASCGERLTLIKADVPVPKTLRTLLSDKVQEIGQPPAVPEI